MEFSSKKKVLLLGKNSIKNNAKKIFTGKEFFFNGKKNEYVKQIFSF